jgi:hypothetical protein
MAKLKTQFNDLVSAPTPPTWTKVAWSTASALQINALDATKEVYFEAYLDDDGAFIQYPLFNLFYGSQSYMIVLYDAYNGQATGIKFSFNNTTKTFDDFNNIGSVTLADVSIVYR